MPKTVVIDEMHLTVRIPADLPDPAAVDIHRTLNAATFMARIRKALRAVLQSDSVLAPCRLTVSR